VLGNVQSTSRRTSVSIHHYYHIQGLTDLDKQRSDAISRQTDKDFKQQTSIIHHHRAGEPKNELCDLSDNKHEVYPEGLIGEHTDSATLIALQAAINVIQNVIHIGNEAFQNSGSVLDLNIRDQNIKKEWD
jgi:hypothetical protein